MYAWEAQRSRRCPGTVRVFLEQPPSGLRRSITEGANEEYQYLGVRMIDFGDRGCLIMAGVEGLEPPTPGFGDRCSSQLSYTPSGTRTDDR